MALKRAMRLRASFSALEQTVNEDPVMKQIVQTIACLKNPADQVSAMKTIAQAVADKARLDPLKVLLPLMSFESTNNTHHIDVRKVQSLCDDVLTDSQKQQLQRGLDQLPSKRYRRCLWCCARQSHANVRSVSTAATPAAADLVT